MTEAATTATQRERYRIVKPIGTGGMSQVFEAFDETLKRTVALKELHPHLAANPQARARFAREALATARLRHRNIVEIFDVAGLSGDGVAEDAFIVTELIHGPTLAAFAEAHSFAPPAELALCALHELASALEHAHANGIVHRDLKLENVMLTETGTLKLMDFGIARILDSDVRMTMTGALVGSPLNMSPEIVEGEVATPASDIFSAGTIFHWLVCGEPPFLGNNASQTLKKILDGDRSDPRLRAPFLSEAQCAFLDRCLDRDPARRFANGGELREAIEVLLAIEEIGDPAARLAAFVVQPDEARASLSDALVSRWLIQAEAAFAQAPPNMARAIDRLDRALCVAPQNAEAQALLTRIQTSRHLVRRRARLRRIGFSAAGLALIAAGGALAWNLLASAPPPAQAQIDTPLPSADAEVAQTASFSSSSLEAVGLDEPSPPLEPPTHSPEPAADDALDEPHESIDAALPRSSLPTPPVPAKSMAAQKNPQPPRRQPPKPQPLRAQASVSAAPTASPAQARERGNGNLDVMLQHAAHGLTWGKLFLDGEWVNGHSPTWSGEVESGRHELRVEAPCCLPETRQIRVAEGDRNPPVMFRLLSRPALLSVVSDEACDIWLGGIRRASCAESLRDPVAVPMPNGELRGEVSFLLVRPGHEDVLRTERFEAGQERKIHVSFGKANKGE
ncbi:MAG: protein kinase [Myxococcales bacterium]|jgi:serine/threonine-protein kinase|nr:protein kinase [Myxococcales bacterium]